LDLYDDAIADYDRDVARVFAHLDRSGRRADTVVVLLSDHGRDWSHASIPLLFVFPDGAGRRRVAANAQLIDVAPTLLDYLGMPVPPWMDGVSLLTTDPDPARPVVSVRVTAHTSPPFPHMGAIGMTFCERVFWLAPRTGSVTAERIPGHPGGCRHVPVDAAAARPLLVDRLRTAGYDVSALERGQMSGG
jgi:arylsulfatase A-like enzyme